MTFPTKHSLKALTAAICLSTSGALSQAAPLQKELVASSAKWVLHLDGELFRKSKVGAFAAQNVIDKKFAEFEQKADLNLDFDFTKVTGITAYSNDFEKDSGVLLVRTSANVSKDIQTIIEKARKEGKPQDITKVDAEYPLYNLKGESFVAPDVSGVMIFSKSRPQLEAARGVLMKKGESLAQKNTFTKVNAAPNNFLIAMVQGLSDQTPLPPNAQILKQASGAAFMVGEDDDKTVVQALLHGKNGEAATQIMQVVQGLIALVNLNQEADEKVRRLAQAASVTREGDQVTVKVALPSEGIINDIAKKEGISR